MRILQHLRWATARVASKRATALPIFRIGGVITLGTMAQERSMTNTVCIVITVRFVHRSVAWAKSESPRVGALVYGVPLVVVDRGQLRREVMDHMRITGLNVEIAARAARVPSTNQVEYVVLERNGSIRSSRKASDQWSGIRDQRR